MKLRSPFGFILVPLLLVAFSSLAQKKILDHDVYDQWNSIGSIEIMDNGKWIAWEREPHRGDGEVLVGRADGDQFDTLYRASDPHFSSSGKYLVVKLSPPYEDLRRAKLKEVKKDEQPKPSVVIYELETGRTDTIKRIKNFKIPKEGMDWMAVLLEKEVKKKEEQSDSTKEESEKEDGLLIPTPLDTEKKSKDKGDRLLVRPLGDTTSFILRGVSSYYVPKQGKDIFVIREELDSVNPAGVFRFDLEKRQLVPLDTNGEDYAHFSVNDMGTHYSWLVTTDTIEDKEKRKWSMRAMASGRMFMLDSTTSGLTDGWRISPFHSARYSEDGERMWIQVQPIPIEFEEDTNQLKEEEVHLDIWSYKDPFIQPMQLKNRKKDLEKGYWARVEGRGKRLIPLENESVELSGFDLDHLTDHLAAYDISDYKRQLSWDYPMFQDLYLVSVKTGEKRLVAKKVQSRASVSPGGKYVYWYDNVERQWKVQDVKGGATRTLSANIPHPVYDVENDVPAPAYPYGITGWADGDKYAVIYDRFDLWKVDPRTLKATRLTEGRDEKGQVTYRRIDLDREDPFLKKDHWLLRGFNEFSKDEKLVWLDVSSGEITVWDDGDMRYRYVEKAREAEVFVIRKEDFTQYPEIYTAGSPTEKFKKRSVTNSQQEEYRWGNVQKVTWTAFDGTELEGLLYTPEDLDTTRKHPMMVYFYETYSDNLNVHYTPKPSASVINFPLFLSKGYVIFVPDIVYKVGDPGKSAYNCIVSGTKAMMRETWIDSNRIGIQGQSWGGYQVAYLVTQTDMYAAAMAGAPVSNMLSAYGGIRWGSGMSREFQYEKTQSRLGVTPWEDLDVYLRNSPVVYADQVNTPLLIMHNDNDGAVPWYQGIEYFMALRRLNKPAWMLVYNNEEHNLMKDHNRKDLSRRMSQFFDHYLMGEPAPEWLRDGIPATQKGENFGFEYPNKPSKE